MRNFLRWRQDPAPAVDQKAVDQLVRRLGGAIVHPAKYGRLVVTETENYELRPTERGVELKAYSRFGGRRLVRTGEFTELGWTLSR